MRFNFRGVGQSTGNFAEARGESDDLRAVLAWARQALPELPVSLAGFSFGSYVAANVANENALQHLVSIAPPVNHHDFSVLTAIDCPWLVVQGEADDVVPAEEVVAFAAHPPAPLDLILLPEVGHFFHGQLITLREHIIERLHR